jgi:probable rRNA maturation factor
MRRLAKRLLKAENCAEGAEVSVLLTDDEEIAKLNKNYRDVDGPTDVLSFSQTEEGGDVGFPEMPEEILLGDVVISVDTAARQAAQENKALDDEIDMLLAHGILHLLGYDHEDDEDSERMFARQREILSQTGGGK